MLHEQFDGQLRLVQLDPLQGQTFSVRKRDGRVVPFDETRILLAIESAFKADTGLAHNHSLPQVAQDNAIRTTNAVVETAIARAVKGDTLEIEFIQDLVETKLMEASHHSVARRYILYREERRKARALRGDRTVDGAPQAQLSVTLLDGNRETLDPQRIRRRLVSACRNVEQTCSARNLADETLKNLYDGVKPDEIEQAMIFAARSRIEREPDYTFVAARSTTLNHPIAMPHDGNIIGQNVSRLRLQNGWTQDEVVAKLQLLGCCITRDILARIETRRSSVTDKQIQHFAEVFNAEVGEFFR